MSYPAVLFPDVGTLAIDAIIAGFAVELLAVAVTSDVPVPRPDELVTVRRLGGPRRDLVTDQAQLAVECWAPTKTEAHDLAQVARALVLAMRGTVVNGVSIYRVDEISGPHELPDPLSTSPRYAFSELVAARGVALNP